MSWKKYVDKQLVGTRNVRKGAIFGLDGSTWAASKKFKVTSEEVKGLVQGFANPSGLHSTGVKLAGQKYTFLRSDGQMIYAKKGGDEGCCVAKTKQSKKYQDGVYFNTWSMYYTFTVYLSLFLAIIVGVYTKGILPGQCNSTVGKLQDYLVSVGY
ncbi:profilin-1A-like [Anneissia japonica]|uniref:profilin-1A-like n=1 Tax=Anneissia japonica TaxID=1529436 RepID=UPI001425674C|nr:profilin-1A-like [Anneissia japonica]